MMNREKQEYYRNLLIKYQKYILCCEDIEADVIKEIQKKIKVAEKECPEFQNMLQEVVMEYYGTAAVKFTVIPSFLKDLRAFSEGMPVKFDDADLEFFGYLYQNDSDLRNKCHADEMLRNAAQYWLDEYHHRIANDELFAGRVILGKLQTFSLEKMGLKDFTQLNEAELELLVHLYNTDSRFRAMCNNAAASIRKGITYWLEEYQRRISKKSGSVQLK